MGDKCGPRLFNKLVLSRVLNSRSVESLGRYIDLSIAVNGHSNWPLELATLLSATQRLSQPVRLGGGLDLQLSH